MNEDVSFDATKQKRIQNFVQFRDNTAALFARDEFAGIGGLERLRVILGQVGDDAGQDLRVHIAQAGDLHAGHLQDILELPHPCRYCLTSHTIHQIFLTTFF